MPSFIPKIIWGPTLNNTTTVSHPASGDPFTEQDKTVNTVAVSGDGTQQTVHQYFEENRTVLLTFLTLAEKTALQTFWNTWGGLGKPFNYYESNEINVFQTYTMNQASFDPKRLVSDGNGDFIYEVTLTMRRNY